MIELSSRYPSEGGLYVWSKRAFGDFSGFMSAWTYWTSNLPYFPAVLYFAASNILFMRQSAWEHLSNNATFYIVFSLLTLGAATLMNIVGLDVGKWLHNVGALAMWIPVGIVIVMGLIAWHRYGSATSFTVHSMTPSTHLNDIIFWSVLTFAFGGMRDRVLHGRRNQESRAARFRWLCSSAARLWPSVTSSGRLPYCWHCPLAKSAACKDSCRPSRKRHPAWVFPECFRSRRSDRTQQHRRRGSLPRRRSTIALRRRHRPLPAAAFGALHPRWKTPWVALLTQFVLGGLFIFLGQAGTSVKGAYDVLVSMGVITYFIPYLYLFAAMIKLQREPAGPDVIRVPGGRTMAKLVAVVGFATTAFTIGLSVIPQPDEPNKPLALLKIVGGTAVLILLGVWIYADGKRRAGREKMA